MTQPFAHLSRTLDEDNYNWLVNENPRLAEALETEVLAGAEPDEIGRHMTRYIGEHRQGLIARCVSAARWLKSEIVPERT
jgi:hypothetical protein